MPVLEFNRIMAKAKRNNTPSCSAPLVASEFAQTNATVSGSTHLPVLVHETIKYLAIQTDGRYIDGTFGRGGHTKAILAHLGPQGRVLALDRDPDAIAAGQALVQADSRLELVHSRFSQLGELAKQRDWAGKINGILLDLGVSSPQLDTSERGFSFMHDGPLDMRMNPQAADLSAAQWIAQASESEIAQVLYELGEERHARRIARAIVTARQQYPIERTGQLATIIKAANPAWERNKHPATRSFQAIRIYVNQELEELKLGLESAFDVLSVSGRLLAVSFHSLEDRIVKRFFRQGTQGDNLPRNIPIPFAQILPRLRLPIALVRPTAAEVDANPRARSAILRVAEKCR